MSRRDAWEVMLLDRRDRTKTELSRVHGGSLSWSTFRSVPGTGSISLTQTPGLNIDWLNDRIRVTHINGSQRTPHGVWLLSMPGWDTDGAVTRTTIALSDKCEALNSPISGWVTIPAGTNIVDWVTDVIRQRGETVVTAVPSSLTLATARTWDPHETTWLQLVNDLLRSINYASLWADMQGYLRIEPYRPPSDRPAIASYGGAAGDLLMKPQWSDEADLFDLPTGVRVHVDGNEDTPGFVGRADLPASHPLSAANRGRDHIRHERGESPTVAVAHQAAQNLLDSSLQVLRSISVTHPIDPTQLNDVVHHRPSGLDAAIVEREVRLEIGAVVTDRIRHIYTGGELPWPIS